MPPLQWRGTLAGMTKVFGLGFFVAWCFGNDLPNLGPVVKPRDDKWVSPRLCRDDGGGYERYYLDTRSGAGVIKNPPIGGDFYLVLIRT